MNKPFKVRTIRLLSLLLIFTAIGSIIFWNSFARVSGTIYDITFSNGDQSQVIEYDYNNKIYEAEYTLSAASDLQNVDIHIDKSNPEEYLLAPSLASKNATILAGSMGLLGFYYSMSKRSKR